MKRAPILILICWAIMTTALILVSWSRPENPVPAPIRNVEIEKVHRYGKIFYVFQNKSGDLEVIME